ncbi:MAG: PAAR domain-containing protein [Acetobacteraceae bacterium]|nr:PAAR domain-containing protein [Acetobacteraceae bacterium]
MSGDSGPGPSRLEVGLGDTGAAFGGWWQGLHDAVSPPAPPPGSPPPPPPTPVTRAKQAAQTVRRVQTVVASVAGVLGTVQQALDTGFAELTAPIAALFPPLPAATLGMPYLGVPHIHEHPPSLIPPAPPIPLPSFGVILFGPNPRVLINGIPAARASDLGLAPTCGGFTPFFEIITGSSKVFIGGMRAARMGDFCQVCIPPEDEVEDIPAGKFMAAVGAAARGAKAVIGVAGQVLPFATMAADISEAAVEDDASMAAAEALAAVMAALEAASMAIRDAMAALMGKDPGEPNLGNVLLGHPNVLIGGFPMINIPNPAEGLLNKLSRYRAHVPEGDHPSAGMRAGC